VAYASRVPVPLGPLSLWYGERLVTEGYFYIWRSIQDNPLWKEKPFSRGQAWVDLILMAQHSDGDIHLSKGFIIEAKRGDILYGLDFLSNRWGWGKPKVVRFKEYLLAQEMADDVSNQRIIKHEREQTSANPCQFNSTEKGQKSYPKAYPRYNILNIRNYNYYQGEGIKGRTPKRTPDVPQAYPPNKCIKNEESMSAKKKTDPDVKTFILEWIEIWSQKFRRPYAPNWGKEGKLVKEMLKIHPLQELRKLKEEFFRSRDSFIESSDYSIGIFKTQLNKLIAARKLDPVEQAREEMRKE